MNHGIWVDLLANTQVTVDVTTTKVGTPADTFYQMTTIDWQDGTIDMFITPNPNPDPAPVNYGHITHPAGPGSSRRALVKVWDSPTIAGPWSQVSMRWSEAKERVETEGAVNTVHEDWDDTLVSFKWG